MSEAMDEIEFLYTRDKEIMEDIVDLQVRNKVLGF
jgi:hypothetical protein